MKETWMPILLILGTIFALITLALIIMFLATGGKNNTLRYMAGGFGLASGLIWLIKTMMR
jgi:hypothetical protein